MHESSHHARARFGIPCDSRTRPTRVRVPFSLMQLLGLLPSFKRENAYLQHAGHPIPTDLEAAKALSSSPAALDLFTWLSHRCFTARGRERVPLFGEFGLVNQFTSV